MLIKLYFYSIKKMGCFLPLLSSLCTWFIRGSWVTPTGYLLLICGFLFRHFISPQLLPSANNYSWRDWPANPSTASFPWIALHEFLDDLSFPGLFKFVMFILQHAEVGWRLWRQGKVAAFWGISPAWGFLQEPGEMQESAPPYVGQVGLASPGLAARPHWKRWECAWQRLLHGWRVRLG